MEIELAGLRGDGDSKAQVIDEDTKKPKISPKKKEKAISKSLKYLKRCNEGLAKDIAVSVKE